MTNGVRISGYSHVAIAAHDIDAARRFYCDVLGFEEIPRPDFGFPGMWLQVGDLQLHFMECDDVPGPGKAFTHFALHVPTGAFASTIDALRAAGVNFVGQPARRVDFGVEVWAAFVADPSGNIIELTDVGPAGASR